MASKPATFTVDVDGIGPFTFKRRTMRDEIGIGAEKCRLLRGIDNPTAHLAGFTHQVAMLVVLTIEAPKNWDALELDPDDQDSWDDIGKVVKALNEREVFFRTGGGSQRTAGSARIVEVAAVPVSQALQPPAD